MQWTWRTAWGLKCFFWACLVIPISFLGSISFPRKAELLGCKLLNLNTPTHTSALTPGQSFQRRLLKRKRKKGVKVRVRKQQPQKQLQKQLPRMPKPRVERPSEPHPLSLFRAWMWRKTMMKFLRYLFVLIRLMEKILHQDLFEHPKLCRIFSTNSIKGDRKSFKL